MPVPLIALAGYGVSLLAAASIVALHAGRVVVPRVAAFPTPPRVVLHPDLVQYLPQVGKACAWWRDHDFPIGQPEVFDLPERAEGYVRIVPPPPGWSRTGWVASAEVSAEIEDDEHLDDAHEVDVTDLGMIRSASIVLDPGQLGERDVARVVAHELGHAAFGFLHVTARLGRKHAHERRVRLVVPKSGHLMHPDYSAGGWGMEGLRARP